MRLLEKFLERVAIIQRKYPVQIAAIAVFFTIFMLVGASKIYMQSDMDKEMPQQLPIYQLNNRISDKFQGQDTIFLLISLDEEKKQKNTPEDIRNPKVINFLIDLENELVSQNLIDSVSSPGTYLKNMDISSLDSVRDSIESFPAIRPFFSDNYKHSLMILKSNVGSGEKKIVAVTNLVNEKTDAVGIPAGVKVIVTGSPPLRVVILKFLQSDAIFTVSLASAIILVLLFIIQRSFSKGLLVFIPLALGLIWTLGAMGWLSRPISIATVGLGAMILGLGVEYGIFMLTRYTEERNKGRSQLDSLKVAVPAIGTSIMGSGLTTIFGFLALTLSILPMMANLGIALAMGIFFCLIAAIFVMPALIIIEEYIEHKLVDRNYRILSKIKKENKKR